MTPEQITAAAEQGFEIVEQNSEFILKQDKNKADRVHLNIPEGVTVIAGVTYYDSWEDFSPKMLQNIGGNPWYDGIYLSCRNIKQVTLPRSLKAIGRGTFQDCGFDRIKIPDGVICISPDAFTRCRSLRFITLPDSAIDIGESFCLNSLNFFIASPKSTSLSLAQENLYTSLRRPIASINTDINPQIISFEFAFRKTERVTLRGIKEFPEISYQKISYEVRKGHFYSHKDRRTEKQMNHIALSFEEIDYFLTIVSTIMLISERLKESDSDIDRPTLPPVIWQEIILPFLLLQGSTKSILETNRMMLGLFKEKGDNQDFTIPLKTYSYGGITDDL